MARKLDEARQAIVFAIVLSIAIAALYAYVQATQPPQVATKGLIRVGLIVEGDGWTIEYRDALTRNNTVFLLLLEAADDFGFDVEWIHYEIPQGVFITAINLTTNGHGGKYWQYWVNGQLGDVAADRKELFDQDQVLWKFDVPQAGA